MAVSPVRKLFVGTEPAESQTQSPFVASSRQEVSHSNGNPKPRRRPKGHSLHKIKGFAAWSRRAEAALLRREMERASPARVSLSDDTLAPFQLRAPYESYFRHGAPLHQRQAAEAAVEEVLNTIQHSTEDAQLLASLGGTLRSAVAAPESFKHGAASTVRGGEDGQQGDHRSVASRALGGVSSDAALEAWVAAAARGEAPPPDALQAAPGNSGESVTVGGRELIVSMSDDGLRDASTGASLDLGITAHKRRAALKQAVARALTSADGRPPWNADPQLTHTTLRSGQVVGDLSKNLITHDSSHRYYSPGGGGPQAFMHSPADAGKWHPLRPSHTTVSSPVFSPARGSQQHQTLQESGATPPSPGGQRPSKETAKLQQQQLAAVARRGSMLPAAAAARPTTGGAPGSGMGAIAEGAAADAAYYAQLYQAMDAQAADAAEQPSPAARRPPPSIPGQGSHASSAPHTEPAQSNVATSPIRAPVRTRQRLSSLERSRRAVKAALGSEGYM